MAIKYKLETVALKDLHNNTGQIKDVPENPRFIRDDKFVSLVKSLTEDPEMLDLRELIAYDLDGQYIVIGGNQRLRASKECGFTELPIKILDKNTPKKFLRAIIIKDNLPYGEDDMDLLANEWELEELEDFGLYIPEVDLQIDRENKEIDVESITQGLEHECPRCKFKF